MRYLLDVVLVVALAWIGWLWNNEKNAALAMSDEISQIKFEAAQVVLERNLLKDKAPKTEEELAATRGLLERTTQDLKDKTAALESLTVETEALRTSEAALKVRVDELQGYKDLAQKAVLAEKPAAPAPAPTVP